MLRGHILPSWKSPPVCWRSCCPFPLEVHSLRMEAGLLWAAGPGQGNWEVSRAGQGPETPSPPPHLHQDQPGVRPWLGVGGWGSLSDWPPGTFSGCDMRRICCAKQSLPPAPPGPGETGRVYYRVGAPPCPLHTPIPRHRHTPVHTGTQTCLLYDSEQVHSPP